MATLKELATRCNVSKMTVIRTIDSLGLRGEHVVKKGERGMLDIDDYAASLIADTLMKRAEPNRPRQRMPSRHPRRTSRRARARRPRSTVHGSRTAAVPTRRASRASKSSSLPKTPR